MAVSCPLAYPAHQAELEKRTLGFDVGMRFTATFGVGRLRRWRFGAGDQQK